MISLDRVMVLSPHTDDGEIGAGGTIARLIEEGKEVYYVAFSSCEESVPGEFPKDTLKNGNYSATTNLLRIRLYIIHPNGCK